jgi:hypothetical protein
MKLLLQKGHVNKCVFITPRKDKYISKNTTQKTPDRVPRTPIKTGVNSVHVPLVAHVLFWSKTNSSRLVTPVKPLRIIMKLLLQKGHVNKCVFITPDWSSRYILVILYTMYIIIYSVVYCIHKEHIYLYA